MLLYLDRDNFGKVLVGSMDSVSTFLLEEEMVKLDIVKGLGEG